MKKRFSAFLMLFILCSSLFTVPVSADSLPSISAESYMVLNADSGRVVLAAQEHTPFQPAEQLVVFALLAAIKSGDLEQTVTIPETLPLPNNSLQLNSGDTFRLKDLIEMTALNSSVQSLFCIAEGVFGSPEKMAASMQDLADTLGCQDTTINSIAFDDPSNQTSVYDLVLAGQAYIQESPLSALSKTVYKEFIAHQEDAKPFLVYSTNSLVSNYRHSSYLYGNAFGIKEAYHSSENEFHLLTHTKKGNKSLIIAVAKVPESEETLNAYTDAKALSEYIFESYATTSLLKADEPIAEQTIENAAKGTHIILKASEAQSALLPSDLKSEQLEKKVTLQESIKAPVKKGDVLGTVAFYFQGNLIGESALYSDRSVSFQPTVSIAGGVFQFISHPMTIVSIILLLLIFAFLVLRQLHLANQKAKKRHRSRKK